MTVSGVLLWTLPGRACYCHRVPGDSSRDFGRTMYVAGEPPVEIDDVW